MTNVRLEDFNFEGISPEVFSDFSCTKRAEAIEQGKLGYRRFTRGNDSLLEILPKGSQVERQVFARTFPEQIPYRVEIWVRNGSYEFKREYHEEESIDFNESGQEIRRNSFS